MKGDLLPLKAQQKGDSVADGADSAGKVEGSRPQPEESQTPILFSRPMVSYLLLESMYAVPTGGASFSDKARQRASEVFSKIIEMGVPSERVSLTSSNSTTAQAEEVHIYLKN